MSKEVGQEEPGRGEEGRALAWIKRELAEREYRPLWHGLAILSILVIASFLFYRSFTQHGTLMAIDMTWPSNVSRLQFKMMNTWYPYGSLPTINSMEWFFWMLPGTALGNLLHLSISRFLFVLYLGTFSMAGISMYVLSYKTVKQVGFPDSASYAPYVASVFAATVYMYNPWSVHYLRAYFAYPIYAFLPLLFLVLVRAFERPSARNIILFTLFVSLVNTTHQLVWFLGLLVSYCIYYLVRNRLKLRSIGNALKVVAGSLSLYLVVNALWTAPYTLALATGRPFQAYYAPSFTEGSLSYLSMNNTMANNFRLVSFWAWSVKQLGGGMLLQALLFAIPSLVVVALIVLRKKIGGDNTVVFWGATATVALLLSTGASWVLQRPYRYLVFHAPLHSVYGWMLRSSERWLFFVPAFFALMLGLLVARLLVRRPTGAHELTDGADRRSEAENKLALLEQRMASNRSWSSIVAAVLVVAVVVVSMYPQAVDYAKHTFNPVNVPRDYKELQGFLDKQKGEPRVAWMPFFSLKLFDYKWAGGKLVGPYSIISSNPNLNSLFEVTNQDSYYHWLEDIYRNDTIPPVSIESRELMLQGGLLSRLLIPFSTGYLAYDTSVKDTKFGLTFTKDASLSPALMTRSLRVYKTGFDPGYFWGASATVKANSFFDNLAITQKYPASGLEGVAFTDGDSYFGSKPLLGKKYGAISLNDNMRLLNRNTGFEKLESNRQPVGWVEYFHNPQGKITTDKKVKAEGARSLRLENRSTKKFRFTSVITKEVPVTPNGVYTVRSSVKCKNVSLTHVEVQGFDKKEGKWVTIARCPNILSGNQDWKDYSCSLWIPPQVTRIRPVLAGGWVKNSKQGPAKSWFDDVQIFKVKDKLYKELNDRVKPPEVKYEKLSAEKYRVTVKGAKKPFVLVQSETFGKLWVARTRDGRKIEPIPMYATINGFPIDKTGDFTLTVEYEPQRWFYWGLAASMCTILVCCIFLVYDWRRKPRPRERAKGRKVRKRRRKARKVGPLRRVLSRIRRAIEEPPKHRLLRGR